MTEAHAHEHITHTQHTQMEKAPKETAFETQQLPILLTTFAMTVIADFKSTGDMNKMMRSKTEQKISFWNSVFRSEVNCIKSHF